MKRQFPSTDFLLDDAGGEFQQLLLQKWLLLREFPLVRDLHREIMLRVFLLLLHAPHILHSVATTNARNLQQQKRVPCKTKQFGLNSNVINEFLSITDLVETIWIHSRHQDKYSLVVWNHWIWYSRQVVTELRWVDLNWIELLSFLIN